MRKCFSTSIGAPSSQQCAPVVLNPIECRLVIDACRDRSCHRPLYLDAAFLDSTLMQPAEQSSCIKRNTHQPTALNLESIRRLRVSHSESGSGSFTSHNLHQRRYILLFHGHRVHRRCPEDTTEIRTRTAIWSGLVGQFRADETVSAC